MRVQIMHLPAPAEQYPFVLVLDQIGGAASEQFLDDLHKRMTKRAHEIGAVGALIFTETVEVV